MRQQLAELVADIPSPGAGAQDLHIGVPGELRHHLPAGAAGHAVVLPFPVDGDAHKLAPALADGLDDRGARRAPRRACAVLH